MQTDKQLNTDQRKDRWEEGGQREGDGRGTRNERGINEYADIDGQIDE